MADRRALSLWWTHIAREVRVERIARWRARFSELGLTVLLGLEIIVIFIVIPLVDMQSLPSITTDLMIFALLAAATVVIISRRPGAAAVAILAGAGAVMASYLREAWPSTLSLYSYLAFLLVFFATLTVEIGRAVFGAGRVTAHRIQGAIVIYLHIAVMFSLLYHMIFTAWPDAFASSIPDADRLVGFRFLYFSFTTLTTIGYGDIVPLQPVARSLANLEGIVGQLYPATLLARLVALEIEARRR